MRKRKKESGGLVRGLFVYIYNCVAPIRGRQKIPEPLCASLRFSVVVYMCISTFLEMVLFRGQGITSGAHSTSGSAGSVPRLRVAEALLGLSPL